MAVACGDGGGGEAAPTTAGTAAPPVPGEHPPATEPAAPGAPGTAPVDGGAPAAPAPSSTVVAPGEEPPPPALPEVGGVGSLAATYLRPNGAPVIALEVRSQDGAGPDQAVVGRVAAVLTQVSRKPVDVVTGAGIPGGSQAWTADQLRALADQGAPQSLERSVLRLLFLHGGFAENDRAVGVAVRGDVAAVFADRIDEAAGVFGDRQAVEDAVTLHEIGHLLGLVDLVVDTGREDPEHPGHSPNRGSVMYYAVESTLLGSVLAGGPPRDFDADDLAELAAIRDG